MSSDVKNSSLMSRPMGLIIGSAAILLMLVVGVWWLLRTDYEPLLSESNPESRAETLSVLMQWQIPYKIDEATGAISIPSDQIAEIRSRLSGMGLPATQIPGLEIFQQSDYGMSEFAQKINYQRGLEGELARTIRTFEEVKSARVHLTLAKTSLFENRKESAKASVVVQLKPNRNLTQQQVAGIQQLVSSAIIGLNPEQVVVLDELGKSLMSGETSEVDRWSTMRDMERDYEERGRHLIAGIVPDADISISVKLQANFDRVKSVKETFISNPSGDGYLVKKREQVISGKTPASDSSISTQNNNTTEVEYTYGKEHAEIEYASGVITKVSIGVVIIKESVTQEIIDKVNTVLHSGLGLSENRGDSISIVSSATNDTLKIDNEETFYSEKNIQANKADTKETKYLINTLSNVWTWVIAISIILLLAITFFMAFSRRAQANKPSLTERERQALLMELRTWLAQDQNGAK